MWNLGRVSTIIWNFGFRIVTELTYKLYTLLVVACKKTDGKPLFYDHSSLRKQSNNKTNTLNLPSRPSLLSTPSRSRMIWSHSQRQQSGELCREQLLQVRSGSPWETHSGAASELARKPAGGCSWGQRGRWSNSPRLLLNCSQPSGPPVRRMHSMF